MCSHSQRPHKFHPANIAQQFRRGLVDGVIPRLQSHLIVPSDDLDVLACGEPVRRPHRLRRSLVQRLRERLHRVQEHDYLVCGPRFDVFPSGLDVAALPFRGEGVACVDERGVKVRFRRQAGGVEPRVPVDVGERLGCGRVGGEEGEQVCFEVVGVEGLAGKGGEVVGDVFVPFGFGHLLFEVGEEGVAFLVRDAGESVVGVFALEVDDHFRKLVRGAELRHRVLEGLPSDDGGEVPVGVAVHRGLQPALEICRPALVEPEVFPAGVGDQVAAVGMREFVGYHVDVLSVARDHGRGGVCVDGILHPSVGKAGREDEHVVLGPLVRKDDFLDVTSARPPHTARNTDLDGLNVSFRRFLELPLRCL